MVYTLNITPVYHTQCSQYRLWIHSYAELKLINSFSSLYIYGHVFITTMYAHGAAPT